MEKIKRGSWPFFFAFLAIAGITVASLMFERPISEGMWNIEDGMKLKSFIIRDLPSLRHTDSIVSFRVRCESVRGLHGVKIYPRSRRAKLCFDSDVTTPEKVREDLFIPLNILIYDNLPEVDSFLRLSLRCEGMFDPQIRREVASFLKSIPENPFCAMTTEYGEPLFLSLYAPVNGNGPLGSNASSGAHGNGYSGGDIPDEGKNAANGNGAPGSNASSGAHGNSLLGDNVSGDNAPGNGALDDNASGNITGVGKDPASFIAEHLKMHPELFKGWHIESAGTVPAQSLQESF